MKKFLIFVSLLFWACSFGHIEEKATYRNAMQKDTEEQNIQTEKKEVDGCLIVKTLNTFEKEEFEKAGFEVKGMLSVPNSDFLYWNIYKKDAEQHENILNSATSIKGVILAERDFYVEEPKTYTLHVPTLPMEDDFSTFGLLEGDYKDDPVSQSSGYALDITNAMKAYKEIGYGEKEVVLAILDTGLNMEHKDFKDADGNSIVLYAKSCLVSKDGLYVGDNNPFTEVPIGENWDKIGHGTHCAGIMAATGNNNVGIAGVAWKNTKIISYQTFGANGVKGGGSAWAVYGSLFDLTKTVRILRKDKENRSTDDIKALPSYLRDSDFKITQKTVPCNMSLGGSSASEFAFSAVTTALKENILPVMSMGNDGIYLSSYPAAFPGSLAVGATTGQDKKMKLSTSGSWISVSAPGDCIKSCWHTGEESYQSLSGSSMASAFVTGTLGYLLSFDNARNASPYQLKALLEKTSDKIDGKTTFSPGLGHGRVNVFNATKIIKDGLLQNVENPYSNATIKVVFKNKGLPCGGSLTLIDDETKVPILYLETEGVRPIEIKGLMKYKTYSFIGTYLKSKEKKMLTLQDADETVEFNFNENLVFVCVARNNFYNHGYDRPRFKINVTKARPDGKPNDYESVAYYAGTDFKALPLLAEENTAYYVEITASVEAGHFFGGNYALKITDAPIDVDAGLNVQDATRADDAIGKNQNDSHENDNRNVNSRRKENAYGKEYAGNLVSPGKNYFGVDLADKDFYWFTLPPSPTKTLTKPNKPTLEARVQSLNAKWDAVPDAKYYLLSLFNGNGELEATGFVDYPKTEFLIGNLKDVTKSYTVTVKAMGNLINENDSEESEPSEAKNPL